MWGALAAAALVLGVSVVGVTIRPRPAYAGTACTPDGASGLNCTVNSKAVSNDGSCDIDPGDCTLIEALGVVNVGGGGFIDFDPSTDHQGAGPINITGPAQIGSAIEIVGNGSGEQQTVIDGNESQVFFLASAGELTLDSVRLTNGSGGSSPRGGFVDSQGILTITDSVLTGATAGSEGGLVNSESDLVITNSTLSDGSAPAGGLINHIAGSLEISSSTLEQGTATEGDGGAIRITGGSGSIHDSTLDLNQAAERGGAIFSQVALTVTETSFATAITKTVFGARSGGCIHQQGGSLTVSGTSPETGNSLFAACDAIAGAGGAIAIAGGASLDVSGTSFVGPRATTSGGAIDVDEASGVVTIADSVFDSGCAATGLDCTNAATEFAALGGALAASDDVTVTDSVFRSNAVRGSGGAIALTSGTLVLVNSAVFDNDALNIFGTEGDGGGLAVLGGTATVENTTFGNATSGGNSANRDGGAILNQGTLELTNVTVSGNDAARDGGGLATMEFSTSTLRNVTIADNSAAGPGGGGGIHSNGSDTVENSVLAGNLDTSSPPATESNCSVAVTTAGGNVVSDDTCLPATDPTDRENATPLLGALAETGGSPVGFNQGHVPAEGSDALDAATQETCPATDQAGDAREDGDLDGVLECDSGAVEAARIPVTITAIDPEQLVEGQSAEVTITGSGFASAGMTVEMGGGVTVDAFQRLSGTAIVATVTVPASTDASDQSASGLPSSIHARVAPQVDPPATVDVTATRADGAAATCGGCLGVAAAPEPQAPATGAAAAPPPSATPIQPGAPEPGAPESGPLPAAEPVPPSPAPDVEALPPEDPVDPDPQRDEPPKPPEPSGPPEPEDELERPQFTRSLARPSQVDLSLDALAGSALAAALLILLIAFPAELFNKTWEENHSRIQTALRRWTPGRRGEGPGTPRAVRQRKSWQRAGAFIGFAALMAFVYGFLEPGFDPFSREGLVLIVGLLIALVAVTVAYELTEILDARRRFGVEGPIRVYAGTSLFGIASVVLSRLLSFTPGYMYGFVAGADVRVDDEKGGAPLALAAAALMVVAGVAWGVWIPIDGTLDDGNLSLPLLIVDATLVGIVVAGIEGIVFGLAPLRYLDGEKVRKWNPWLWLALYFTGVFALVHVFMHPEDGLAETASNADVVSMFVLFAGFGLFSLGFWAYFRYTDRDEPPDNDEPRAPLERRVPARVS